MIIADRHIAQGSGEWLRLRLGVLTASRVNQLISSIAEKRYYGDCGTKHGSAILAGKCRKCEDTSERHSVEVRLSEQRHALVHKLAAEWATGAPTDDFDGSYWTERGEALEGQARAYFELQTGFSVEEVPLVYRDEERLTGCSPDGLVMQGGEYVGGLELKCPSAATHVRYLLADHAGEDAPYAPQVQYSLWNTGLPSWWFMSYHPGLPPVLREIQPDPAWQSAFDEHVPALIERLEKAKAALREMGVTGYEPTKTQPDDDFDPLDYYATP